MPSGFTVVFLAVQVGAKKLTLLSFGYFWQEKAGYSLPIFCFTGRKH